MQFLRKAINSIFYIYVDQFCVLNTLHKTGAWEEQAGSVDILFNDVPDNVRCKIELKTKAVTFSDQVARTTSTTWHSRDNAWWLWQFVLLVASTFREMLKTGAVHRNELDSKQDGRKRSRSNGSGTAWGAIIVFVLYPGTCSLWTEPM